MTNQKNYSNIALNKPKKIYAIQHRITKKIYIGVTNSLELRYQAHLSLLRNNKHNSPLMQEEYNQYGGEYDVFVLDEIQSYSEKYREYEWMKFYKTKDPKYGYNSQDKGGKKLDEVFPLKSGHPERLI